MEIFIQILTLLVCTVANSYWTGDIRNFVNGSYLSGFTNVGWNK